MNKIRQYTLFLLVPFLFSLLNCSGKGSIEQLAADIEAVLPADTSQPTTRPVSEYYSQLPADANAATLQDPAYFNFKTLLKTQLKLKVNLFDLTQYKSQELRSLKPQFVELYHKSTQDADVTVLVEEKATGHLLFAGKTNRTGDLQADIIFPAHVKDCEIKIIKAGYHERKSTIAELNQVISLESQMSIGSSQLSQANAGDLADSDSDKIPDVYDAFPSDPARAFKVNIPEDSYLTITFEDNFPAVGDADYNDFIARYRITQISNAENKIVEVHGDAFAVARVAGYDHRFGLRIDFAGASARVDIYNSNHACVPQSNSSQLVANSANIVLFERTKQAFTRLNGGSGADNGYNNQPLSNGHRASFAIVFDQPVDPATIDNIPYDPYLFIHNTGFDVHLLGKPSLPNSTNPQGSDGFRDGNGYPRAMLVPVSWQHPLESTHIEQAYLQFQNWRQSIGQSNSDWYFYPVAGKVFTQVIQDQCIPQIITTSPLNQATDVRLNSAITVEFSKVVDVSSVAASSFQIRTPSGQNVEGFYSAEQNIIRFIPKFDLQPNLQYQVQVNSQLKMFDGSFLPQPYSFSFTTTANASFSLIKELEIYQGNSQPLYGSLDNLVLFGARHQNFGLELFKSDGSFFGTSIIKDLLFGAVDANPQEFISHNGKIIFVATGDFYGRELYVSDASLENTVLLKDIFSGSSGSQISQLVTTANYIYFVANDGIHGLELWRSDGTPSGTVLVKDVNAGGGSSNPSFLTPLDPHNSDLIYFSAYTAASGTELWVSDGSNAGTTLAADIKTGTESSLPENLLAFNGKIYFAADDGISGIELWQYDPAQNQAQLFGDLFPGGSSSRPQKFYSTGSRFFFLANDGVHGQELYSANGAAAQTQMLADLNPGFGGVSIQDFAIIQDTLYFSVIGNANSSFLYKTKGISGSTQLLYTFASDRIDNLVNFQNKLYFTASDGLAGNELWLSNGSPESTYLVKDFLLGSSSSNPTALFVHQNWLYFSLKYEFGSQPEELWVYRP